MQTVSLLFVNIQYVNFFFLHQELQRFGAFAYRGIVDRLPIILVHGLHIRLCLQKGFQEWRIWIDAGTVQGCYAFILVGYFSYRSFVYFVNERNILEDF